MTLNKLNLIALTFFLLAGANTSFAQFFKAGTITTSTGETVEGYIKNNSYEKLSEAVVFKTDKSADEMTTYTANDLQRFSFADGDTFEAFDIEYAASAKTNDIKGTRFLHLLQEGTINLYELRTNESSPLFVQKNNGIVLVLGYGKNDKALYREILKDFMADNPKVKVPNDLALNAGDILELIQTYNNTELDYTDAYKPTVIAWATAGVPYKLLNEGFQGFVRGAAIESGFPVKNGMVSGLLGMEFYEGKREVSGFADDPKQERAWYYAVTLRGQYTFMTHKVVSPYVAIGTKMEKSVVNSVNLHTAIGANVNLGRHRIKVELADPTAPSLSVGYGFSLIK